LAQEDFSVLTTGIVPQHEMFQRKVVSQYTYNVACMSRYPDHTENFMREQGPLKHFRCAEGRLLWSSIWHSGPLHKKIRRLGPV